MKLWQKDNTATSALIENFTVGNDKDFDILLAKYDVQGSIAHVKMLGEVGLMTREEANTAIRGLEEIAHDIEAGKFKIEDGVEDIHSQVELLLTQRVGEAGKKFMQAAAATTRWQWISNCM
jgi:argininosuccinate lyase (EC 4.3.2.1)